MLRHKRHLTAKLYQVLLVSLCYQITCYYSQTVYQILFQEELDKLTPGKRLISIIAPLISVRKLFKLTKIFNIYIHVMVWLPPRLCHQLSAIFIDTTVVFWYQKLSALLITLQCQWISIIISHTHKLIESVLGIVLLKHIYRDINFFNFIEFQHFFSRLLSRKQPIRLLKDFLRGAFAYLKIEI